ncbi:MAG: tetratricopeptide repeat protein [Geitlerinemataceae cyanobacterium]
MSKKRGSWMARIAVLVGLVGLLGFSVTPMVSAVLEARQSSPPDARASAEAAEQENKADLEDRARGYELVLQREPDNETALLGLLQIKLQLNDIKGTVEPLEKLAQLNPQDTRYKVLLAQTRQYTGDREGAAQTYRNILTSTPGNVQALEGLSALLVDEGRPEAAIGLLEDTLSTAPQANQVEPKSVDVTSVRVLLGGVYAQQQRYEDALQVYNKAIEADNKDFRPLVGKAIVLKQQGKIEDARPLFDKALALAPAQYKDQIQVQLEELDAPSAQTASPEAASPEDSEPSSESE